MKKYKNGYITCYLALTVGILLSLIFTLFEAIRVQTIRMEIEGVMDVSLFSIFGEFHRELLNQYELFFIDSSYGEGKPEIAKSEEHLQYYMNQNFEKQKIGGIISIRDLTNLHSDNIEFTEYSYATDAQGAVLKTQILDYMQLKKGVISLDKIMSNNKTIEIQQKNERDFDKEWDAAEEELWSLIEEKKKDFIDPETGEQIPIEFDNPASHIKNIKAQGTLGLVLSKETAISTRFVSLKEYYSYRAAKQGKGKLTLKESVLDKTTGRLLLNEYFMEKCSHYQTTLEKAVMKYQIEYLLHGRDNDLENLEATVEDILRIREGINFVHLLSDSNKLNEADALALLLSAVFLSPEIKDALKLTILFAWNYAESVKDVRILMDGNQLPLQKTREYWNTPLVQLFSFTSHLGEYKTSGEGLKYQDYLQFFLSLKKEEELLKKFADICEMDIRETNANQDFQMDGCIYSVSAKANVSSEYGYGYEITRKYKYE